MKNLTRFCLVTLLLLSSSLISPWPSLVLAQNADVAGIWSLSAQGISTGCTEHTPCQTFPPYLCGTDICGSFQMGDPDIHVSQSGNILSAMEIDTNGMSFVLDGVIVGDAVTFTIRGLGITPGIGPASTTYSGIRNGNIINGSLLGSASWTYADANGNPITETATWTGTFTVTITGCDFSWDIGTPERCFGGIGTRCKGDAPGAPFVRHDDTCRVDGWMSAGSILHDTCCYVSNNEGYSCTSPQFDFLHKPQRYLCGVEWNEAIGNTVAYSLACGPWQWRYTWGPYPAGNTGDISVTEPLPVLKAPVGAYVNPKYKKLCPSGSCSSVGTDSCGNKYCVCK